MVNNEPAAQGGRGRVNGDGNGVGDGPMAERLLSQCQQGLHNIHVAWTNDFFDISMALLVGMVSASKSLPQLDVS